MPLSDSDLCRICGDPLPPRGQGVELREICLPCRKTRDQAFEAELVICEALMAGEMPVSCGARG